MIRKIIKIDKEKCNGCGACASACHEGAIDIIDGKAELVREHFCDGLGDCLPECPTGAISFEEREAPAYDEEAVKEAQKKIAAKNRAISSRSGCPGSKIMQIRRTETSEPVKATSTADSGSKLQNWPVQIKLAPVNAPYFNGSKLLIAADCTAYAYAAFHQDFIRNKVTLIGNSLVLPLISSIFAVISSSAIFSTLQMYSLSLPSLIKIVSPIFIRKTFFI